VEQVHALLLTRATGTFSYGYDSGTAGGPGNLTSFKGVAIDYPLKRFIARSMPSASQVSRATARSTPFLDFRLLGASEAA